jgi:hypothetical protein
MHAISFFGFEESAFTYLSEIAIRRVETLFVASQ